MSDPNLPSSSTHPSAGTRSKKPSFFASLTSIVTKRKKSKSTSDSDTESVESINIPDSPNSTHTLSRPSSTPLPPDIEDFDLLSTPSITHSPPDLAPSPSVPLLTPLDLSGASNTSMPDPPVPQPRTRAIELPVFTGTGDTNISDYIHTFTRIKKANGWPDDLALDYLKCNLRGLTSDWLRRYENIPANAAKTLTPFLTDLKAGLRAHLAERELYTRFQRKGEDVRVFVADMLRLIDRMDPETTNSRKITLIKNNSYQK